MGVGKRCRDQVGFQGAETLENPQRVKAGVRPCAAECDRAELTGHRTILPLHEEAVRRAAVPAIRVLEQRHKLGTAKGAQADPQ